MRRTVTSFAHARVGFLGNPSDIYGGKGIGFGIADLGLDLRLVESKSIEEPNELVHAVVRLFAEEEDVDLASRPFSMGFESSIPFQCGLAGSSAILVAALRALAEWYEHPLSALRVAELALRAEVERLQILAGPLDRLVQAHEGLIFMDFAQPFAPGTVVPLDPALLPRCVLAWDPDPGSASGFIHNPVYERWKAADTEVQDVVDELAEVAVAGRTALEGKDYSLLRQLVDRNFDLRASLFDIRPRDEHMIVIARSQGAAAKFCGSGGSVIALPAAPGDVEPLRLAYQSAGYMAIVPTVTRAND
jgi:glucuronokinase